MALFYDKVETPALIEYRFHFLPLMYIAMGLATACSLLSRGERTNQAFGGLGIFMFAWIAGIWKPMAEIQHAMTHGSVEVTGSKFSFSNPMRVILRKSNTQSEVPGSISSRARFGAQ